MPVTAGVSNQYARRLFDMAVGFSYARILYACVKLDLLRRLQDGPASVPDLARALRLSAPAAQMLLKAAASLGLLEAQGGGLYRLGPMGAALLGNPGVEAMILHHSLLYEDLRDPVALLRADGQGSAVAAFWPYGSPDAAAAEAYSRLMAHTQTMIARQVVGAVSLRGRKRLMDVGGGEGVFIEQVAKAAPHLDFILADLPEVAERAAARLACAGLAGRVVVHGLDARAELPAGADVISFVRVLHDHDDAEAAAMLRRAFEALPRGGRVLVAEPMAGTPGARAMGHGYFGVYLFAMGQGRPRTARETAALLRGAGFCRVREHRTAQPVLVRVLSAVRV
jgi:demethylspheroidene O-methyltransferase